MMNLLKTTRVDASNVAAEKPLAFVFRLAELYVFASLAYLISLKVSFPGYIALPAPFHSDMYWSANLVAQHLSIAALLHWPRPIFYETLWLAGHFGFTGSLLFLDAICISSVVGAFALFEEFVLRRRLPWFVAVATFLFAMVGPGFYSQPGYDVGLHVAIIFALLGVYIFETRVKRHATASVLFCVVFFTLSALTNEGIVPGLVIYAVLAAYPKSRSRQQRMWPALAVAISLVAAFSDGRLTHSPFVAVGTVAHTNPYFIDLSTSSILGSAWFYVQPLTSAPFNMIIALCLLGAAIQRRIALAMVTLCSGLILYLPYSVLPNHLDVTYQWAAMPLVMLLVPIGWPRAFEAAPLLQLSATVKLWALPAARLAFVVGLAVGLAVASTQFADQKHWLKAVILQNRALVSDLSGVKKQVRQARSILVCGLSFPMQPFSQSAAFVSAYLKFNGTWTVATESQSAAVDVQAHAKPISYNRVHWADYDLIMIVGPDGHIVRIMTPAKMLKLISARHFMHLSKATIVSRLSLDGVDGKKIAAGDFSTRTSEAYYPPGIVSPDRAGPRYSGIYEALSLAQCCFLNAHPSFLLEVPRRARIAVFSFYVPEGPPFVHRPETIGVVFDGHVAGKPVALASGLHNVQFAIKSHTEILHVTMNMGLSFVPKQLGINGDMRELSVMLLRVTYRERPLGVHGNGEQRHELRPQ